VGYPGAGFQKTDFDIGAILSVRKIATLPTSPIAFENVDCMICGNGESIAAGSVSWRNNTLSYALCQNCGLKFMNPRPTRQWYLDFYEGEFWQDKFQNKSWQQRAKLNWIWRLIKGGVSGRLRKGRKRARLVVPEILRRVKIGPKSRVLDIGCAFGLILDEIKTNTGADVFGIEPNLYARSEAERRTGVKFIGKSAEDVLSLQSLHNTFDLIIFSNVLENIVDPRPILGACRQLLSENGVLYVDSPNVFYYDAMNPYHPYVYSPETLSNLLGSCGLATNEILFEKSIHQEIETNKPFAISRPRFITVFSTKGNTASVQPSSKPAIALLEEMAISSRRHERLKGSP
jgi:2-polyprenyl-3-methyl-5-hydroxy-6-metoxy-1,4-benzoquinol methylase